MMLFRPLYAQTAGGCGTAYVGFANGSSGNSNYGYGAIGDGYSKDALSNYYCGPNTFTHEIGHSLGNVHDREYSSFTGKFSYSYAWGIQNKFGTIMSYYGSSVAQRRQLNLSQYRQILSGMNRIIYEVRQDTLYIHVIVDARRNMTSLLTRRLLRINLPTPT
jgi:hypothetical protein